MAHQLPRLRQSLLHTPLLLDTTSLENLLGYIDSRGDLLNEDYKLAIEEDRVARAQKKDDLAETDVGIIRISGALTYEATVWEALCGNTSYQTIQRQYDELVTNPNIKTIVLDIDSGGGEAYSLFEVARYLRKRSNEEDKRLIAYVDGMAASAAYGLASAADEIIVNPMGEVGSVGVVVRLLNENKRLQSEGIEQTYVHAGSSKIPFNAEGEFREDFIEDLQDKVNELYEDFTGMVSEFRGVDQQDIKDTEAAVFTARGSVDMGLADEIMTRDEFSNYLADLSEGREMPLDNITLRKDEEKEMSKTDVTYTAVSMEDFQALQKQLASQLEANNTLSGQMAELTEFANAAKAEKEALEKEAHNRELAELSEKFKGYSFATGEAEALVKMADSLDASGKELLFGTLDKAKAAIDSVVTEELSVEGEAEIELSEEDINKEATAKAINAKYGNK